MKENSFKAFDFGFITFDEVISNKEGSWIVEEAKKRCNIGALSSCPDIFDDLPIFFYIVDKNNTIACSRKVFPDRILFNNHEHLWAWTGDTLTDPRFRKRGLASLIVKESIKVLNEKNIGVGSVFFNDVMRGIYKKVNFSLPGYADRFIMIKNVRPIVENFVSFLYAAKAIEIIGNPIFKAVNHSCLMRLKTRETYIITVSIDEFKENKAMFDKVCFNKKFHFNQKMDKVLWKLKILQSNDESNTIPFFVYKRHNDTPIGYFIIRSKYQKNMMGRKFKNFKLMTLMDYGMTTQSETAYMSILYGVINEFLKSDNEILEIISNSEKLKKLIKKFGVFRGGKGMPFAFAVPQDWDIPACLSDIKCWHLSHFAGDGFSF